MSAFHHKSCSSVYKFKKLYSIPKNKKGLYTFTVFNSVCNECEALSDDKCDSRASATLTTQLDAIEVRAYLTAWIKKLIICKTMRSGCILNCDLDAELGSWFYGHSAATLAARSTLVGRLKLLIFLDPCVLYVTVYCADSVVRLQRQVVGVPIIN